MSTTMFSNQSDNDVGRWAGRAFESPPPCPTILARTDAIVMRDTAQRDVPSPQPPSDCFTQPGADSSSSQGSHSIVSKLHRKNSSCSHCSSHCSWGRPEPASVSLHWPDSVSHSYPTWHVFVWYHTGHVNLSDCAAHWVPSRPSA